MLNKVRASRELMRQLGLEVANFIDERLFFSRLFCYALLRSARPGSRRKLAPSSRKGFAPFSGGLLDSGVGLRRATTACIRVLCTPPLARIVVHTLHDSNDWIRGEGLVDLVMALKISLPFPTILTLCVAEEVSQNGVYITESSRHGISFCPQPISTSTHSTSNPIGA